MSELKIGKEKNHQIKKTIKNITNFFDLREKIIDFFRDYSFLLSEANDKVKYGEGLTILTPKQMLQGLPIACAQIIPGNNSEILLN